MRKRKLQVLVGIVAALVVAALIYATRENDPVYQGKRLSEYLKEMEREKGAVSIAHEFNAQPPRATFHVNENHPTLVAVDHVGTNALPLLVRMLQNKESRLGLWVRTKGQTLPLIGKFFRTDRRHPSILRTRAAAAFYRLGPRARPALPDIIPLLNDSECASGAVAAIEYMRPERESDIVSLTNVFGVQGRDGPALHLHALFALATFGTNASGAVPALVGCLSSTNALVRGAASAALARIGAPAERVVPMMIQNLSKTSPPPLAPLPGPAVIASVRAHVAEIEERSSVLMTLWAFAEYGTNARAALPAISNLFDYPAIRGVNVVNVHTRAMEAAAKILADTNSVPR